MAYTKVFDQPLCGSDSVTGTPAIWEYVFGTLMPATGWTTEMWGASGNQSPSITNDRYWFCKKTVTFTDGTTGVVQFVCELEWSGSDINYYGWDGVKATTDGSDPDYGMGTAIVDTFFGGWSCGTFQVWQDGDSFFVLRDAYFVGLWLPDGGWVRQDLDLYEVDPGPFLAPNPITLPAWDTSPAARLGVINRIESTLPQQQPLRNKLTDYVGLRSGSATAMWFDVNSELLGRASSYQLDFSKYPKLIRIGDEATGTYWFGPTATDDGFTILFNMGNTDPGY